MTLAWIDHGPSWSRQFDDGHVSHDISGHEDFDVMLWRWCTQSSAFELASGKLALSSLRLDTGQKCLVQFPVGSVGNTIISASLIPAVVHNESVGDE